MKAYVNGEFVDLDKATLSIHDAGVQHAVGLFETMQAFNGRVFRLEAHVDRLIQSARELGMTRSLRHDPLCECVEATLKENDMTEARLRLTVTGGDLSLLGAARSGGRARPHTPTVLCVAGPPTEYPPGFFADGVTVTIADGRANPFDPGAGHKTLNYWPRLRALADAAAHGAGEALWLSVSNHLAGGSVSNALLVKDGVLLSPYARGEEASGALPAPVLPGITRSCVLELAESMDNPVHRRMITIEDVLGADELMLTNSSWQILPVVAVEKSTIGDGKPGELTAKLRHALLKRIEAKTMAGD
ncbi:MAG: hypothetical protein GVY24_03370 [Planctomycetes bacterium]|jgi:branched-subunit amino acid aminotransferase/4-amino-4-deoxychorismate lyase|nr:hypothetical protein [Planctomycetota bacterium]